MSTHRKKRTHRIFLLSVWQEDDESWRFLIEDPRSGKRRGFAGYKALTDGLPDLIGLDRPTADSVEEEPSLR